MFLQQGVEIEPKKNQRRVRDEEKQKEKEKSNLKTQKSTWFCRRWAAPSEAGAGRWCLGPRDWRERGPEVAGFFGEKSERVAGFFWSEKEVFGAPLIKKKKIK